MRIICAPDSFKESLSAREAAEAMARGVQRVDPSLEVDLCPIADGGEGTVEALVTATGGRYRTDTVTGPLGDPVEATWGILGDGTTAVIEIAAAAGLAQIPQHRRDPTQTTTCGVGELIAHALDAGCARIIVGLGGSATTDGGCGLAQALGATFHIRNAVPRVGPEGRTQREAVANGPTRATQAPITGGDLPRLESIDLSGIRPDARDGRITVACDVTNPLYGESGAAYVYGPQKGATPHQVRLLDEGLRRLASLLPHVDANFPGAGSAGGLGFGLVAFLNAEMRRGIRLVLATVGFAQRLQDADLVLTGEGQLDAQSLHGKAVIGVANAAAEVNVPVIALVGSLGEGAEKTLRQHGGPLNECHALTDLGIDLDTARREAAERLAQLTTCVVRGFLAH